MFATNTILDKKIKKIYPVRERSRRRRVASATSGRLFSNGIYMVGIKGAGMSSLAVLLKKLGHKVTGSDTSEKFFTEAQLQDHSIPFFESFSPNNLKKAKPDLVVTSTAYEKNHPEISAARSLKIKTLSYPEMVGQISKSLHSVAVCGSHGKTTTTSMLGTIMEASGRALTLTGTVAEKLNKQTRQLGSSASQFFIFEADEYQNKFQYYQPDKIILTNIDYDHPDFFKNKKHYFETFKKFVLKTSKSGGFIIFNYDDTECRKIFKNLSGSFLSYGYDKGADYVIENANKALNSFSIFRKKREIIKLQIGTYGRHNILNAAASAIMALKLGANEKSIKNALKKFTGAKRRMELVPNKKYIVIDDYGHHPTEIKATLAAIRNKYPNKKIVAVFHPHTFTRTQALFKEFGNSFQDSDLTIVLDIYTSAREKAGKIHSRDLVKEIKKNGVKAVYRPAILEATEYIKSKIPKDSLILTIGAGDVWKLTKMI